MQDAPILHFPNRDSSTFKMLKLFILAVVAATAAADLDSEWAVFKSRHQKQYTNEVERVRKYIWTENKKYIESHNKLYNLGLSSFYLGENQFADMTNSEFVAQMNGMKVEKTYQPENVLKSNLSGLPDTVDWRSKGYVTGVKNQAQCGSCWAFSTTGSLEGQHFKKTGDLVSLSESNLMDCSRSFGNDGCEGGLMDNAFKYIISNKGIDTERSYPYVAKDRKCQFKRSNVGATMSRFTDIPTGSETELQKAVALIGPISVAIDASHPSFQLYRGGVYNEVQCSSSQLDHGVLAVGYGTSQGKLYWLVKNSWGVKWGIQGYIMMSRNRYNQCGIATQASYPIV